MEKLLTIAFVFAPFWIGALDVSGIITLNPGQWAFVFIVWGAGLYFNIKKD